MELEGLKRSLSHLLSQGVVIAAIVTDRHLQIQAWLRKNYAAIKHFYDVWHVAKGV